MIAAWTRETVALVALVGVIVWNVSLWRDADPHPPAPVTWFGELLNLRQKWGMFTRLPSTGWLRAPGTLRNGTRVDLLGAGGPLPDYERAVAASKNDRPALISASFRSVPWLVFFLGITEDPDRAAGQLRGYGRYVCSSWNARDQSGSQLTTFEVIYAHRPVDPHQIAAGDDKYQRRVLWMHDCFG